MWDADTVVGKWSTEGLGLVGVGYNLNRVVGEGLSEKGRFEQSSAEARGGAMRL